MKFQRKTMLTLLLSLLMLFTAVPMASAASYTVNGAKGEITLPLKGLAPGATSTNCWEFAQTVYKAVWGENFSGYRGDADDLLRSVGTGRARAITTANTRDFISAASLGATIRVTTNVDGDDNNGSYKHSMILIGKDDNGFTVYEGSIYGRVRIKYYTWSDFANGYFGRNYKYFKYIKWPGANAYGEAPAEEEAEEAAPAVLTAAAAAPAEEETAPVTCLNAMRMVDYTVGDVNNDGQITSADARLVLRSVVMLENYEPGTIPYLACDVNADGKITSSDARLIIRCIVQLEELPLTAADDENEAEPAETADAAPEAA